MRTLSGTIVETRIQDRDIRFFVHNPRDYIQSHHLQGIFYEREELAIISRHFHEGGVFIDIGANIGNHTIFIEKFCNPRSIITFEINPIAIEILQVNILLNALAKCDTSYLGFALAAGAGMATLVQPDPNNLGLTMVEPDPAGRIRGIAGDEVLAHRRVDFLKIDIEGGEMAVLAGLAQTIALWRPAIFIEVDDHNAPAFAGWCASARYRRVDAFQRYEGKTNYMILPEERA